MDKNIIKKLKESGLLGRSGSGFPTYLKWSLVKKERSTKKYIICNAAEGDPGTFKDGFILKNYPEEVIDGIKIALETIDNSSAYIYLRKDYYKKFGKTLKKLIKDAPIKLFKKTGSYLAGEETVVIAAIEGKRLEPTIKPPYPTKSGLFGCPTIINNVETFYCVSKVKKGEYKKTRFYSISGDIKNKGVYEFPENLSIRKILKKTGNWPKFSFFVQVGGGAIGEILLPKELNQQVGGTGAIIVFNLKKTDPFALMKKWVNFFMKENCDKCTPCREGTYRMAQVIKSKKIDKKTLNDLFFVLEQTSLCALGKNLSLPFKSLIKKVLHE